MTLFAMAVSAMLSLGPGDKAPEFDGGPWINAGATKMADLKGKVVLVEFWTFGCWNCKNVEPHVKGWHDAYAAKGLVVVGVHTPELEHEKSVDNVKSYVAKNGIKHPVLVDGGYATWTAFGNRYWPALYLIDKTGTVRYTHFGEGAYEETARAIEKLLAEDGKAVTPAPAGAAPGR
jgi:thiol-disulfide isomerase/thioredoxin